MEDLTRFGLVLISIPVAVVAGGLVLGLVGRWVHLSSIAITLDAPRRRGALLVRPE